MTGSFHHAGREWPVLDGIPFLRAGREALADAALAHIAAGREDEARLLLLADQDDWWTGPPAQPDDLRRLLRERDRLSLREAMALLGWGRVGDYFAHRWSDPTFVAGLALTEAYGGRPRSAVELACGIGHHLRALRGRGAAVTGLDVVWAKLWVARHWVVPDAALWCLDAAQDWPDLGTHGLVCCHDALYFLRPKEPVIGRLRGLRAPGGVLLISHVHNRAAPNHSAGEGVTAAELRTWFPGARFHEDAELTRAAAEGRAPREGLPEDADAFSLAEGDAELLSPGPVQAVPPEGALLRRNPLYGPDGALRWPSKRYEAEYAPLATYPPRTALPEAAPLTPATREAARRRELVDLPERW